MSSGALGVWRRYRSLALREQLFVQARLWSAPLTELAKRAARPSVVDIGCGHGVLCALLQHHGALSVLGVDPDARKIAWARAALGPSMGFEVGTVEALVSRRVQVDAVTVADVMYLLKPDRWPTFLASCRKLLKPNGTLFLKEAVDDGSWKVTKAKLQEQVMVQLLKRTHSSGGLSLPTPETVLRLLREASFSRVNQVVFSGYTTPHQLFEASF